MKFKPIPDELNRFGTKIVDAAYQVHKELGPGLLESVYEECLVREFEENNLSVKRQISVPFFIVVKPWILNCGLTCW